MTVEVTYHARETHECKNVVGELDQVDGEILEYTEMDHPNPRTDGSVYRVTYEYVAMEEQYIVRTVDGMGKESRTYYVRENDDGNWEVDKRVRVPNKEKCRYESTRGQLSTPTVREALAEYDVEVIN